MEEILIKTSKICHNIYSFKLVEEVEKYEETIYSMSQLRLTLEAGIKKLKEENKELKFLNKSEMESQRELKKNKSDQDDIRKKDEYRS